MLNKDDLKQIFEIAKASRREFFDYIAKMGIAAMASSLNLSLSEEGQAEPLCDFPGFASLLNKECLLCYLIGLCIIDGVPVPKIKYKVPVGFAETGDAGQFGASSSELSVGDYSYFTRDLIPNKLNPYIPLGTRYGYVGQGQAKMQLYPHYYGLSPMMITQVQKEMSCVNKKNPVCTPCLPAVVADVAAVQVHQVAKPPRVIQASQKYLTQLSSKSKNDLVQDFYGNKQMANKVYNHLRYINSNFYKISGDYTSAYSSEQVPSVPSELFAYIWALPELSLDEKNWKAVMLALQNVIQQEQKKPNTIPLQEQIKPYELTCPYMYNFIIQNPEVAQAFASSGLDPSFVCVGLWGNGYPRAGVVEATDPIVGGLLSIARWHDLISTTITADKRPLVATPPQASWYQMYNPYILEVGKSCFRPGWIFSDFTVNNFNNLIIPVAPGTIGYNPPSPSQIEEYFQDPEIVALNFIFSNLAGLVGLITGGFSLSGFLHGNPLTPTYRNVGVIVWVDRTMCCVKSGGSGFGL